MQTKTFDLIETKADAETGSFTALASVFGNVDHVGDRMMPGSFSKTLAKWRASGDPIPVILSHKWDDPWATVGEADPRTVYEDKRGLVVQGQLDMDNPLAKQVHKLMGRGLLKGWSFGYTVPDGGQERKNGANEINEVDLVEVGPTLKGANPEAQLQAVKSGDLEADEINWAVKEGEEEKADAQTPTDIRSSLNALMRLLSDTNDPREQQAKQIVERLLGMVPQMQGQSGAPILLRDEARAEMNLPPAEEKATSAPWDGSASRFTDEQYARSAVLDRAKCGQQHADEPAKQRYSLPIREPGGALNSNAVHAAAARINQVQACAEAIASAKNALRRAYGELGEEAPDSIKATGIEGGKADAPRPRDPLKDKFDRILLGLE